MVWSDQSQFPFFVYDNNGNLILTIDQNGLRLSGPHGNYYVKIDPNSGVPFIAFDNDTFPGYSEIEWDADPLTPYGVGLEFKVVNAVQNNLVALAKLCTNGVVYFQGSDGANTGLNGPLLALDSNSVQFKNSLNQSSPVAYSETTKWFEVQTGAGNGWNPVGLLGGWSAKAGYTAPAYRVTADGFLCLRGTITGGTTADNTGVFNLPIIDLQENPPANIVMRPAVAPTGSGSPSARLFYPMPNALSVVYCYGMSGGVTDIALDGLRWSVDHV